MNNYKAVFFDFDYTLADSSKGVIECINYALQKMGYPKSSPESICKTICLTLSEAYRELSGDTSDSNAELFRQYFKERADIVMCDGTIVYNTVESVLKRLKSMNLKTGIVSTKYRYRIEDILKRDGLLQYFDVIIGGEDVAALSRTRKLLKAMSSWMSKERSSFCGRQYGRCKDCRKCGRGFCSGSYRNNRRK